MKATSRLPTSSVIAVVVLTCVAGALRLINYDGTALGNVFYASAVRSMGGSLHNFWFVALDPNGFFAIDKPPLALWTQVLSTKLFGFDRFALALPMALLGALAVAVIAYAGKISHSIQLGIVAAVVLAVFPEAVATSRDTTMDAMLMFFLCVASCLLVFGVEKRNAKAIVLFGFVMGLAFNIKFFQGFVLMPAAAIYVLWRLRFDLYRWIGPLLLSAIVCVVICLSWLVAVDSTPEHQRPRIFNDKANSVLTLALNYNGIERVLTGNVAAFGSKQLARNPKFSRTTASFGIGNRGIFRLFGHRNGLLIGFTLVIAISGVIVGTWRNREWMAGPGLFWGSWLLVCVFLFSYANRAPAHYTEAYVPAISIMSAIALIEFSRLLGPATRFLLPTWMLGLVGYGYWGGQQYPDLATTIHIASAVTVVGASAIAILSVAMAGSTVLVQLRLALSLTTLALPAALSFWIMSEAPYEAQITRPNPLIYASIYAPKPPPRKVPVELALERIETLSAAKAYNPTNAKYQLAIGSINNSAEAIAYNGIAVLPLWNEYRRTLLHRSRDLHRMLHSKEIGAVLLRAGTLPKRAMHNLTPFLHRFCGQDLGFRYGNGWTLWLCF